MNIASATEKLEISKNTITILRQRFEMIINEAAEI